MLYERATSFEGIPNSFEGISDQLDELEDEEEESVAKGQVAATRDQVAKKLESWGAGFSVGVRLLVEGEFVLLGGGVFGTDVEYYWVVVNVDVEYYGGLCGRTRAMWTSSITGGYVSMGGMSADVGGRR